MAPSRMTTRSTRPDTDRNPPDAKGSSRGVQPGLDKKLDQMLAALAEVSRKVEIAHETIMGLKDEVAEVHRDNARLEGLLANEARSEQGEDFDAKVQQESEGQPLRETLAPSRFECRESNKAGQGHSEPEDTKKALKVCFPTGGKK
ncbi:hypothetical protein PanWU01x14_357530 [Parasponia andersonii]|uniref:Uncharacterized protein n=1 Tax=Parasponia andersonii TaxID=3476 RepID=A0A2P5A8M7_PARAD|nr:hypothetical protein PanWU01x14_357530 [Parasponia andersonii]